MKNITRLVWISSWGSTPISLKRLGRQSIHLYLFIYLSNLGKDVGVGEVEVVERPRGVLLQAEIVGVEVNTFFHFVHSFLLSTFKVLQLTKTYSQWH